MPSDVMLSPTTPLVLDRLLIGISPGMQQLRDLIPRVAQSPLPVLIHGPTGAGKELVARAIHATSRCAGAFVPFNVSAIPDSMFADALFGHERGAFTHAVATTPGYLREAHQGTVFLDEIGGLAMANQMTLLRVLETRSFRPLGATRNRQSDFRVISATNDDLGTRVARGEFREDLVFRLQAASLYVPPLRERLEDIPVLVQHFLAACTPSRPSFEFTPEAFRALQDHDWPGNIWELRHLVQAVYYLAERPVADAETVMAALHARYGHARSNPVEAATSAKRAELVATLERHANDIRAVAAHYGCTRATVYRWLQACRIPTPTRQCGRRRRTPTPSGTPEPGVNPECGQ